MTEKILNAQKIIDFLHITHCFYKPENVTLSYIVEPITIEKDFCIVMSSEELKDKGTLVIQCKDSTFTIKVFAINYSFSDDDKTYFKIIFIEHNEEFTNTISSYLNTQNNINKRKHERYIVGLEKSTFFGLDKQVQTLYTSSRNQIRCIINNVSVTGVKITGDALSLIAGKDIVSLVLTFTNSKTLVLKASVIRIEKKTHKLFQYSLHFIEPINTDWQEKVLQYAEKEELCQNKNQ